MNILLSVIEHAIFLLYFLIIFEGVCLIIIKTEFMPFIIMINTNMGRFIGIYVVIDDNLYLE